MGPLPDSRGNKHVPFMGYQFSEWYEVVAVSIKRKKLWQDRLLKLDSEIWLPGLPIQ